MEAADGRNSANETTLAVSTTGSQGNATEETSPVFDAGHMTESLSDPQDSSTLPSSTSISIEPTSSVVGTPAPSRGKEGGMFLLDI